MDLSEVTWRKSRFSNPSGNCVELGVWRKSRFSNPSGNCVEVSATRDGSVARHKADVDVLYLLRDSKDPAGPVLAFDTGEWDAFIRGAKVGEFDAL